ncbi:MAG: hypothetical protein GY862_21770 [Gammaproteobacteria bacterium]|nr:hypothetical protein [Gammaproteobacteria bacterium]
MKNLDKFRRAAWAVFLCLNILPVVFAATANDISATHCTIRANSCGKQLAGSVRIDFDSIRWIGLEGGVILRADISSRGIFGFTGQPNYHTQTSFNSNEWVLETPSAGMLPDAEAEGSASVSHYFAPDQAGSMSATAQYIAQTGGAGSVSKQKDVQGDGVADSNEAITLNVAGVTGCAAAGPLCEKTIAIGEHVNFTVAPSVNQALVPADVPMPEYVMVELIVQEVNTGCTSASLSTKDRTYTANSFSPENYFHHLYGSIPSQTPSLCVRQLPFLMSAEKSFDFKAIGIRSTGGGYIDYTFFIRGHYDPNAPEKWPYSHKTFRIRIAPTNNTGTVPAGSGCALSTQDIIISQDGSLHIPCAVYQGSAEDTKLWINMKYVPLPVPAPPGFEGRIFFEATEYGIKE